MNNEFMEQYSVNISYPIPIEQELDPDRCEICSSINTSGKHVTCKGNGNIIGNIETHPKWCPKHSRTCIDINNWRKR